MFMGLHYLVEKSLSSFLVAYFISLYFLHFIVSENVGTHAVPPFFGGIVGSALFSDFIYFLWKITMLLINW